MRLITVVMNEENTNNRTKDTIAMMDYGFNMYYLETLVKKNEVLGNIKVNMGKKENANIVSTSDITILNNSQNNKRNITYDINTNKVNAPIKYGDIIGKINVYENNTYKYSVDLTIDKDIEKANIFMVFLRYLKNIITLSI